jgi:opacity protein-like surface antigen
MRFTRSFGITLALLASSAAAQPQVEVWAEPVGMALSAGVTLDDGDATLFYAPVGITWRASPGARPWTVELAPYRLRDSNLRGHNWGARLSAGPVYGAGPGESGAFVQQLGTLMLQRNFTHSFGVGVELGVDVGYRFQLGRLSVTPLLGLGLGVGLGLQSEASNYLAYSTMDVALNGAGGDIVPLYNVTLDLLRVGYSF